MKHIILNLLVIALAYSWDWITGESEIYTPPKQM